MPSLARRTTAAGLTGTACFQLALSLGAPCGRVSYGGAHPGVLPTHLRAVSAASTVFYTGLAWAVMTPRTPVRSRRRLLTGVAGIMGVATVVNGMSPSVPERVIWTPTAALLGLSAWLARTDG
jgi:hypothetical protein